MDEKKHFLTLFFTEMAVRAVNTRWVHHLIWFCFKCLFKKFCLKYLLPDMQEKDERVHQLVMQLDLKNKELLKLNSSAVAEATKVITIICQLNLFLMTYIYYWVALDDGN